MKTWSTEEVPNTLGSPVSTFYLLSLLCTLTNEMTFQYTIENKLFDKIVQYIVHHAIFKYKNSGLYGITKYYSGPPPFGGRNFHEIRLSVSFFGKI